MKKLEFKNEINKNSYLIFTIAFLSAFIADYISLTMLIYKIPNSLLLTMKLFSIGLIVFKAIFYDKFKYTELYLYLILFIIFIFNWYVTRYQDFVVILFLAIGAKNINKQYFVKLSSIVLTIALIGTVLLSKVGIIENLIFIRKSYGDGTYRQSLGTLYPTILGSIIFFLVLQYFYIRKKSTLIDVGVVLLLIILIDKITDNRLVFFLLLLFDLYLLIQILFNINKLNIKGILKYIWVITVVLVPVLFLWICINYDTTVGWMTELNKLLSQRLRLSYEGFLNYPITLFGQSVSQNGWGGGKELAYGVKYFYLDSLPVALILMRGTIIFIGYLIYNFLYLKKAIEKKDLKLAVILTFIVAYDLVDDKSVYLSLNPFVILSMNYFFTDTTSSLGKGIPNADN